LDGSRLREDSPTIAAEITGSVGVRQAEIAKQDTKLRDGKRSNINPGERYVVKPF